MPAHSILGSAAAAMALTAVAVGWVVLLVRAAGLRSLSQMTGFDFVTTIAVGSLIAAAGTAEDAAHFVRAFAAIAAVFALQWLLAMWRVRSRVGQKLLGNDPVLLMEKGEFLDEEMRAARITRADIYAKMREAGLADVDRVQAVVLERTGDISIIRTGKLQSDVMEGIGGYRALQQASGDSGRPD